MFRYFQTTPHIMCLSGSWGCQRPTFSGQIQDRKWMIDDDGFFHILRLWLWTKCTGQKSWKILDLLPILVGGLNPAEKYESQLGWWHSQFIWKNNPVMFQTTNLNLYGKPTMFHVSGQIRIIHSPRCNLPRCIHIYQPYINHISTIYQPCINHISTIYQLYIPYISQL